MSFDTMVETYEIPDELLARCVGRVDVAQRVVDAFVKQLQNDVPQLIEEVRNGRGTEAAKLAHRIKGSSANVAADELREDAACLERMAHQSQFEEAAIRLEKLESDWQHYVELTSPFLS